MNADSPSSFFGRVKNYGCRYLKTHLTFFVILAFFSLCAAALICITNANIGDYAIASLKEMVHFVTPNYFDLISLILGYAAILILSFYLVASLKDLKKTRFKIMDCFMFILAIFVVIFALKGPEKSNFILRIKNSVKDLSFKNYQNIHSFCIGVFAPLVLIFALLYAGDRVIERDRHFIISLVVNDKITDSISGNPETKSVLGKKEKNKLIYKLVFDRKAIVSKESANQGIKRAIEICNAEGRFKQPTDIKVRLRLGKCFVDKELENRKDYVVVHGFYKRNTIILKNKEVF